MSSDHPQHPRLGDDVAAQLFVEAYWEKEIVSPNDAGNRLQKMVHQLADSPATRAALSDLNSTQPFTAAQLLAVRVLILRIITTRESNRSHPK